VAVPKVTEHGNLLVSCWKLNRGEEIPLHDHSKNLSSSHITIIAGGSVRFDYADGRIRDLKSGEMYDCNETEQKHRIEALEDNTIIYNIIKGIT
jgi:hypothetical protein